MRTYAEGTNVPVERTRAEIERLLSACGASQTGILNDDEKSLATIAFAIKGARFRIDLPMPNRTTVHPVKGREPQGWHRLPAKNQTQSHRDAEQAWREAWCSRRIDQMRRERWRQLLLLLKAKLEAVRLGLSTVEREFLADLVLPNGASVHQQLAEAIRQGLGSGPPAPKALGVGV